MSFLLAHGTAVWPALTAVVLLGLRSRTPAEWVELGEKLPRLQGLIKFLRGAGLDPVKAIEGLVQIVNGKAPLDEKDGQLALLRMSVDSKDAEILMLRAELAAYKNPEGGYR